MVADAYEASPQHDMDIYQNVIQSLSYLWKEILASVRYSPLSSGEYRTSDGANADWKEVDEVLTFQTG